VVPSRGIGFVSFADRAAAEKAVEETDLVRTRVRTVISHHRRWIFGPGITSSRTATLQSLTYCSFSPSFYTLRHFQGTTSPSPSRGANLAYSSSSI
jgi:hypothetical protein